MHYKYTPSGVCSRVIEFDVDSSGKLSNVTFTGGCHGNTRGIGALAEGRFIGEVCRSLRGIDCKGRGTSCPDQLSLALEQAMQNGFNEESSRQSEA